MRFWHQVALRFLLALGIAVAFGWLFSEASYRLLREDRRETPQRIELVIPAGAAERVKAGESTPSLPDHLEFLAGDVLVVKNEDAVSHQLGPIWVPPGASGSLRLDTAQLYSYSCSFQPTSYMGLDVRRPTTALIRFEGVLAVALPSAALLWLYTLLIFPIQQKNAGEEPA